jgi:serine O-acetyltransferase
MDRNNLNQRLPAIVEAIVASIHSQTTMQHLNRAMLPNRDAIVAGISLLQQLAFPGYFGKQGLTVENAGFRVGELVMELSDVLFDQVRCCLRHREPCPENPTPAEAAECDAEAVRIVGEFFDRIPAVRALLATDVQAAFDSDPAASSTDETIFSYPGLYTIFVQRMAHEFYKLKVPLLPRIMTEHAHSVTGIDIHPGAQLGQKMFIDHGTGVVIGQTCIIGENVKIYQGVTLGALAPAYGQMLRDQKRHPTIEDNVVIYSNATILGGETVIGEGAVIGGNVFITKSVPPHNIVSAEPPKLKYRERRRKQQRAGENLDFQI